MAKNNSSLKDVLGKEALRDSSVASAAAKLAKISQQAGLLVLLSFALAPSVLSPTPDVIKLYALIALPIAISALALRMWSYGYVREKEFIVSGAFRYVRNPVELSSILAYTAGAVCLRLPAWYTLGVLFAAAVYMSFVAIAYERDLLNRYGAVYLRYTERVRRWIPSALPAVNPKDQDFLISRALFHDKKSWVWILLYAVVWSWRTRTGL